MHSVFSNGLLLYFIESFSCSICCVQELVSLVRVRFAQILLIEFDDLGIIVRLTECLTLILGIECLSSLLLVCVEDIVCLVRHEAGTYVRLTAAVDASARASHDLDELIL